MKEAWEVGEKVNGSSQLVIVEVTGNLGGRVCKLEKGRDQKIEEE